MSLKINAFARLATVLAVAAVLAGCDVSVDGSGGLSFDIAAGKAQDEWSRSYELAPGGQLELINVNGRITAEASDGTQVELKAERTAKAMSDESAQELLGQIEMREEVGDGRVRVEVRAPRMNGPKGHEIKWTVRVPKGVHVDLRTVNGGVRLQGLDGDIRAHSTNGGVNGRGLRASSLEAGVTNGGVDIELAEAPTSGTFDLESVNGGVELAMPADSKADISARCTNGGVSVTGLDLVASGEQTRRRVEGALNGGGARVSLSTVNGGVRLRAS
ncbi:MAG: DUF4097 family beta strand repeat-containing protein [Vicinamibacterales bacterium]